MSKHQLRTLYGINDAGNQIVDVWCTFCDARSRRPAGKRADTLADAEAAAIAEVEAEPCTLHCRACDASRAQGYPAPQSKGAIDPVTGLCEGCAESNR